MRALLLSPSHLNFDPGALSSVIKRTRAERRVLLLGRCYSDNSGNNLFAAPFAAIVSLLYPIGRRSRSSLARSIKGILRLLEEGATMSLAPTLLFSDCSSQTDRRTDDGHSRDGGGSARGIRADSTASALKKNGHHHCNFHSKHL